MTLIEHIEVGSGGAASIVLDNIPADYTDLYILISGRTGGSGDFRMYLKFNDTNITSSRNLYGTGSSVGSNSYTNGAIGFGVGAADQTASTFGSISLYVPNYLSSNDKSVSLDGVTENNATGAYHSISAGLSTVSSAITKVTLVPTSGSWVQYSSATLYGITAGSDGTTTVS
jgi:hypothetical protein